MLCPYCHHSDGLHSALGHDGRAADGKPLAADYQAGRCGQSSRNADGTYTPCPCPGWYPGASVIELTAATIRAREVRALAEAEAEVPFSLTAPISRRKAKQGGLF